ncbi:MAG: RNA polymerase sigma factor [Chloroflexota bacterium]|nr:RNA polymerase sigma factor [Chloroflexota bacterium]
MKTEYQERYATYADEMLLQLVVQKDATAFAALYDRHAPAIHGLLLRIVRNPSTAEELLQDTFWRIWQKAEQYGGAGVVMAWMHRIARNKALDQLRSQKGYSTQIDDDIETWTGSPSMQQASVEHEFEQDWMRQQVHRALATIPSPQRFCLELAYFEGLSHQEIAQQMQVPLGTIKTRIRIGMQKMERWLSSGGNVFCPQNAPVTSGPSPLQNGF